MHLSVAMLQAQDCKSVSEGGKFTSCVDGYGISCPITPQKVCCFPVFQETLHLLALPYKNFGESYLS